MYIQYFVVFVQLGCSSFTITHQIACRPPVCIMVKSGQEILWSGVFNLLKFDHISKKERKKWIKWSIIFTPHSSQKWIFTLQYKNLPLFIWLLVETHVMYELIWDTSNSKTCSCWYCYHSWIKSVLLYVDSYKSVVCSRGEGRHTTRLCCLRLCLWWYTHLDVWWNGGIRQVFEWALRVERIKMGVEETEAETSKNWSSAMSTPW